MADDLSRLFEALVAALARDERVLSQREKELVATIVQHARAGLPADQQAALVNRLSAAVGSAIAGRVFGLLGAGIAGQVFGPQFGPAGEPFFPPPAPPPIFPPPAPPPFYPPPAPPPIMPPPAPPPIFPPPAPPPIFPPPAPPPIFPPPAPPPIFPPPAPPPIFPPPAPPLAPPAPPPSEPPAPPPSEPPAPPPSEPPAPPPSEPPAPPPSEPPGPPPSEPPEPPPSEPPEPPPSDPGGPPPDPGSIGSLVDPYVVESVIDAADLAVLVSTILAQQSSFVAVQVIGPAAAPGRFETGGSRVLTEVGDLASQFGARIEQILPLAHRRLGVPPFRISRVEAQVTATNDGQSLRFRAAPPGALLTFVFMFHQEPREFTGGELRVFDARMIRGQWVASATYREIPARQNQLVLFPSRFMHEIRTVHCPSGAFGNSLFTLTGWLHK